MWFLLLLFFLAVVALAVAGGVLLLMRLGRFMHGGSAAASASFFSPLRFENQSTFKTSISMTIIFSSAQKTAVAVGALLFHLLFWEQIQGLNLLLWYAGCAAFIFVDSADTRRSGTARAVALGGLLASAGVVFTGSGVAKLAVWASLALLVGLANQPTLRLLHHALLTGAGNVLRAPLAWVQGWRAPRVGQGARFRLVWYYGRLFGLPLAAVVVFHLLFSVANPQYAALADRFGTWLGAWLGRIFVDFSMQRTLFLLFGAALAAGTLLRVPARYWLARETDSAERVHRVRPARLVAALAAGYGRPGRSPVALRKEYLTALAALTFVNGLLLLENVLDIQNIWLGFRPAPTFDLAQFVHEGTWALIVSILLAMALVLYFFRGNLNFYASAGRRLRPLATVWIVQNAVLAVSVGLRNYHYISRMGLAYKRIGVCFFLLLTVFGLVTVCLKVWQRRSAFNLVKLNSWAVYAVLLLLALGNWEIWIARFNLQPRFRASLDREFLLEMPPRVLPELQAHSNEFSALNDTEALAHATKTFLAEYPQRGWLSWNLADARAYEALVKAGAPPLTSPPPPRL